MPDLDYSRVFSALRTATAEIDNLRSRLLVPDEAGVILAQTSGGSRQFDLLEIAKSCLQTATDAIVAARPYQGGP